MKDLKNEKTNGKTRNPKPWTPKVAVRPSGVLIVAVTETKMMLARAVEVSPLVGGATASRHEKKGAHRKVIPKSDQENPILDVYSDVCKQRGE